MYIEINVFNKICADNSVIFENLNGCLEISKVLHERLLKKNKNILENQNTIFNLMNKKKKKKKKFKKKTEPTSLEWWGLVGKIQ